MGLENVRTEEKTAETNKKCISINEALNEYRMRVDRLSLLITNGWCACDSNAQLLHTFKIQFYA